MPTPEAEELYRSTAKGAVFNYLASNIGIVLQFLVTIVFIKFLSVDEYGIYSLFFSTVTFLGVVSGFVLYALLRFIPGYMADKNVRAAKQLFAFACKLVLANGLIVLLLLWLFPGFFNQLFKSQGFLPLYVLLFAVINAVQLLTGVFDWTLNALLQQKARAVMRVSYTGLTLLGTFLAFSLGVSFAGPLGTVLVVLLTSSVIVNLTGLMALKPVFFDLPATGRRITEFRRVLRYGFYSQFSYIGELVTNLTIDNLLIGYFLGTSAIAWYSFGVRMPQVLMAYSPAVVSALVVFPAIVKKFSKSKNLADLAYFFEAYSRFTAFFIFPTLVGLVLLAPETIQYVFDPKYLTALNVFIVAAVSHALLAFRQALINIYNTIERPEIGLYSKAVFIVTTAANILLLRAGEGILIVALVNFAGFAAMLLLEFLLTRRRVPLLKIPFRDLARTLLAALLMGVVVLLGKAWVGSLGGLLLLVLFSAGVYAACCLALKPFPRPDGQLFARIGFVGKFLGAFARK